ncbi:MAG: hypothetical protein KF864_02205 [Phycisphaeraceae bacterium]|nr:hypothetical protein [Phycisphaeraceae bacterium]
MSFAVFTTCLLIVGARMLDVTLGTLRTVMVINGRKWIAFMLGFAESFIWLAVVAQIIKQMDHPLYFVAYALGFAIGNFLGIVIEQHLAFGTQVIRVFSRRSHELATALRASGVGTDLPHLSVTEMQAQGHKGPVGVLFAEVPRRYSARVAKRAVEIDPEAYYVIDDVRRASTAAMRADGNPWDWKRLLQRK